MPSPPTDTLSGSFTFHIGSGSSQTISVDPANNTIAGLAAAINQAGLGVTASVVTDSSGSRLSLISQTGGAAGQITIDSSSLSNTTAGSAVSLTAGQPGQDALFTVDGIQIASATNTVTGAISGVTMQLLGKSTAPVQVEIDNDTASVTNALSTMVKDYNAVVSALTAQEGKDASGNAEPLFGSPIISQLQQMLSSAMTTPSATSLTSPTQVGLSLNSNGTLSSEHRSAHHRAQLQLLRSADALSEHQQLRPEPCAGRQQCGHRLNQEHPHSGPERQQHSGDQPQQHHKHHGRPHRHPTDQPHRFIECGQPDPAGHSPAAQHDRPNLLRHYRLQPEGLVTAMRHYHQAAIESANGVQLIVALYDGLQRFLTQAAGACELHDEAARREAARRALNIVIHLQANLRMDVGGASAERLSDFYTAVFADVLRASASESRQLFLDTAQEVRNVREAWKVAAQDPATLSMIPLDLQTRQEQFSNSVQLTKTVAIRPSDKNDNAAPAWIA